jgi:hypothetical protein
MLTVCSGNCSDTRSQPNDTQYRENTIQNRNSKREGSRSGISSASEKKYDKKLDALVWVVEAWEWLLGEVGLAPRKPVPSWFSLPAMMKCAITTREVLKALQVLLANVPYQHRAGKPFNFVTVPLLDELDGAPVGIGPERFLIVAPFTSDSSRWYESEFVNIYDENIGTDKAIKYQIGRRGSASAFTSPSKNVRRFRRAVSLASRSQK